MKKSSILFGFLIAVALSVMFYDNAVKNNNKEERVGTAVFEYQKFDPMTDIMVKNSEGKILKLALQNEKFWRISEDQFPVDGSKIIKFLDQLAQTKVVRKVANTEKDYKELGLDHSVEISFSAQNKLLFSLKIGDSRSGGGSYVLFDESPKSYLLSRTLSVFTDTNEWELKDLISIDPAEVKEIVLGSDLNISRTESGKVFKIKGVDDNRVDAIKVKSFSSIFKDLKFIKRFQQDEFVVKDVLAKAKTVQISLFSGDIYKIRIGKKESAEKSKDNKGAQVVSDRWFVSLEVASEKKNKVNMAKGRIFEISPYYAKQMLKIKADFVKPAPVKPKDQASTTQKGKKKTGHLKR
jgi:hypothetical protein